MALQNKLKAFVRFDGSGRVIPSSLILQKSKPKVGNWKEINATQCCDAAPTTTTTTTADLRPRISSLACGPLLPYQEITIVNGSSICDSMIYITGDFSQLPQGPFYVNVGSTYRMFSPMGNQAYPMGNCTSCGGGTTTTTTTASAFTFNVNLGFSNQSACDGVPAWNLYAATPFLGNGTTLYYNSQLNWAYDGAYGSYVKYQNVVYTLSGATISDNGNSCSSITTTTSSSSTSTSTSTSTTTSTTTGVPSLGRTFAYGNPVTCEVSPEIPTTTVYVIDNVDGQNLAIGTGLYLDEARTTYFRPYGNTSYQIRFAGNQYNVFAMITGEAYINSEPIPCT